MATRLATRLKRPQRALFTVTDNARSKLRSIISKKPDMKGIRVGVKPGGCAQFKYWMEYATDVKETDNIVKEDDLTVLVDRKAELYIVGTELDYIKKPEMSQFKFQNPNAKSLCACEESFSVSK
mmetsp:Transcript_23305/g.25883  ORF Transcript_23305/g.25883 Transcript_23305/m.25883 type:complete len:124 (+) Transcript_23305:73-444(+)